MADNACVSKTIEAYREAVGKHDGQTFASLASTIIRHEKLQAHLDKFRADFSDDLNRRKSEQHHDECPVCLDALGEGGDLMVTKCGHSYHCGCIIETLADGTVRACPLCRTDIKEIVDPKTCSGQVFTFVCLLRISFDRIQSTTKWFIRQVEKERDDISAKAKSMSTNSMMRRFQQGKFNKMQARLDSLANSLHALELAGTANLMGFQHLHYQLPTITGTRTVADTEFFVTKLDYARDGPSGTTGAHAALRKSIEDIAASLALKLPTPQVPVIPEFEPPPVVSVTPAPTVTLHTEENALGGKRHSNSGEGEVVVGRTKPQGEEATGPAEGAEGEFCDIPSGGMSHYTGFDGVVRSRSSEFVVHSFQNSSTVGSTVRSMVPHRHYGVPIGRCLG